MDIVFPKNNEEEFIKIAKKLDYSSICFVYPLKNFKKRSIKSDIKIRYGILADENNLNRAKKIKDLIFIEANENIRNLVEKNKSIIIFNIEQINKKDFLHQRRSGLNHVACSLATKNNIKIGISFNSLLNSDTKKRNKTIGRIISNIKLCKKYKTKIIIGSFASEPFEMRSYKDLSSFFSTLGLDSSGIYKLGKQ